ncbi:MAG: hypothetical protein JWM38_1634 [Sphingomonas bacterium]|jgi:hypothetical protein|nr:hypothetical protein [Sphingomonas bacterium]MDB5718207.1 hypothetical protein [Sphingomonas bacterium]
MSHTITRLFDRYSDAEAAVREIESLGISHDDVSIVGNRPDGDGHRDHGEGVNHAGDVSRGVSAGALIGGAGGLLAGLGLLVIPGLGPLVAAGWLATTLAGAGAGAAGGALTGSIVGALTSAGHSEEDAHVYAEGVRRGGTLVSARVPDDRVNEVEAVLDRNNSVTAAARGASYRESGWAGFDPKAPAYDADEMEVERARYASGTRESRIL